MKKIDVNKIVALTNQKIAYSIYMREEKMKMKKIKIVMSVFLIGIFLIGGTIGVDAMTDNSISKAIKEILTVKINNKDYNAKCVEEEGKIICNVESKEKDGSTSTFIFKDDSLENPVFGTSVNDEKYEVRVSKGNNN